MGLKKRTTATPIHPDLQKLKDAISDVKTGLDKLKGEKGRTGIQQARETVCDGEKIMMALLHDTSFPAESLEDWAEWCENILAHQPTIDRSAFSIMILVLLRAIISMSLEPQFSKTPDSSDKDGSALYRNNPEVVGRVMKAVVELLPNILVGVSAALRRELISQEGHDPGISDQASGTSKVVPTKSPYVTTEWFDIVLTLLEYAEGKGLHHPVETEKIIDLFETLSTYSNQKACVVWTDDPASRKARLRLGTLIMESKVSALTLHGLRTLVYTLPRTAQAGQDLQTTRYHSFSAAIGTHPRWMSAPLQLKQTMRSLLNKLPDKVSLKPRIYMHMVNTLHALDDTDEPQAFPVRAYSCDVREVELMDTDKAKERLTAGELIVYLDQFGMRLMDFDEVGREVPLLWGNISGRVFNIWRHDDPDRNRFEYSMLALAKGGEDRHYAVEIETSYADKFEARMKRLLPASAWLENVAQIGVRRPSAPDNDSGELVPESSAVPPNAEDETNESRVLESIVELQRNDSHASDSFGLSSAPKAKSTRSSAGTRPSARVQEIKDSEGVEPTEAKAEGDGEAADELEQPRRATRSSNSGSGGSAAAKSTGKVPAKTAAEGPAKAASKAPAKGRTKSTPASTGDAPTGNDSSPAVEMKGGDVSSDLSSPASHARPSRAAKTKSMHKTSGVLSGEAVPLEKETGKAAADGKKGKEVQDAGGEREVAEEREEVLGVSAGKKAPAKRNAKGKAVEAAPAQEEEPPADKVAVSVPEKAATIAREKSKAARVEEGQEEAVDEDVGKAVPPAPAGKGATPVILVPASSQQVPITKPNTISRSCQRYSRDKPAARKKEDEASSDAEDEDEDNERDELQDNIVAIPQFPIPLTKKGSAAAKAPVPHKPAASSTSAPSKSKSTFKAPAPVVPRTSLRSSKPKATIAGEIKSGQAMTPAAVQAKIAAEKSAEKSDKGKEGKNTGKTKAGRKSTGPPKASVEDQAATAPGKMEDVSVVDQPESDVGVEGGSDGTEEGESASKRSRRKRRGGGAGIPRKDPGPTPGVGVMRVALDEEYVEDDTEEAEAGEVSNGIEDKAVVSAKAAIPGPQAPAKKAKVSTKIPTPPPASDDPGPEPEIKIEAAPEPVEVEADAEPEAESPKPAPRQSPSKSDVVSRPNPSRRQAARESPASERGAEAAQPKVAVRTVQAGKPAPPSPSPVEPIEAEREVTSIVDGDNARERAQQDGAMQHERAPTPPRAPASKPATTAGNKRAAEAAEPDGPTRKRSTPAPQAKSKAQLKDDTPVRNPPASTMPWSGIRKAAMQVVEMQIPAYRSSASLRARVDNASTDDIGGAPDPARSVVPAKKRKVSIDEPEVQVKKARREEGRDGERREEKGDGKSLAVNGIMTTIDEISEIVKRRVEDRLAVPDKVITAIDRHVSKVACKAVDTFGTDHNAAYQSLSTQISAIQAKQSDAQTQYKIHTATAKTQHRQVCDLFKLYKRPMEGIPTTLFD